MSLSAPPESAPPESGPPESGPLSGGQSFDRRRSRIVRSVVVVSAITLLLLAIIGMRLMFGIDQQTREHEQAMVKRGLDLRLIELEKAITPQVDWDDAVVHMGNRLDTHWAELYFAAFMHMQLGATRAFVIDGQGHPVYAALDGRGLGIGPAPAATFAAYAPFAPAATRMIAGLRHREGPGTRTVPKGGLALINTVHATTLVAAQGRVWMLSGHMIQPDSHQVTPKPGPLSIALVAVPLNNQVPNNQVLNNGGLDGGVLAQFGQRYRINDLTILPAPPADDTLARVRLTNAQDRQTVGWLTWTPRRPGAALLREITLPLVMLLCAVGWGAWIFLREASKITDDLVASEARARHGASHDMLTGLPNRALMFDRLRRILAMAQRTPADLAIHCLDLDRFKGVNDTLGHHAGDELIQHVARLLNGLCRESDTVARLGGDEFVILQPNATPSGASHLAQRVLQELAKPITLTFGTVEIGCSIGVTIVSDPALDASEALRQADLALYASKEGGRNCANFFEPEMDAALRLRRKLEVDLRKAIAAGTGAAGELHMVYQTQIDDLGHVCGVEALVRWNHPDKGPIMPVVFVPLAEESGLIHELGDYILARVFAETRHWTGLTVAINISALQLRAPVFMATMTRLIADHGIDPAQYELEITETALLGEDVATRANLLQLAQAGFTITLDDFGTGYSSLANLRRFAVDKIKIDRSFVQNIDTDPEAEALVEAIVRLGRALKLDIVAEGVETPSQLQRLIDCGCRQFQGYLIGRPVPAAQLERSITGRLQP